MPRFFPARGLPPAQAPGTLSFLGQQKVEHVQVKLIDYDADELVERFVDDFHECFPFRDRDSVTWINVNGLHDTDMLQELGTHFGLHPLVLEDIVHTRQRPKLEEFSDHVYVVARMLRLDETGTRLESEQISILVGKGYVLTFQERPGDVLEPVRERLRRGRGRIRTAGPGYLGYAILDSVVDHYFKVLEGFDEALEELEDEVLASPTEAVLQKIHHMKREMVMLRRAVWPVREVVSRMERDEVPQFGVEITPFLRDLQDHVLQVTETVDAFRDILSGLQDLYLSSVSNRMNDVMKVLTIFASIFVPLTFVAGIYGMNFEHMPELAWRWSYPLFWVVIVGVGVGLLALFRKRGWL